MYVEGLTLSEALDFTLWYCTRGALLIRFQLSILLIISNCFPFIPLNLDLATIINIQTRRKKTICFILLPTCSLFPWALYRLPYHRIDIARKHAIFMIFIHHLSTFVWGKLYYRSTLTLLVSPHWIVKKPKEIGYSITLNHKMWFYFKSPRLNFYFIIWGVFYSV